MKDFFKLAGMAAGILMAIFIVAFLATGMDFAIFKFWAPKMENVKREVFEGTKSYQEGMAQELVGYYTAYAQADSATKNAIKGVVLHKLANYPPEAYDRLPDYLKLWVSQLNNPALAPVTKDQYQTYKGK
jgi:hypothetical protein